jgi:hypothetical protein
LGLLDQFSNRARARRVESRVEFLGEQDGAQEGGLKRALVLEFATRPAIQRAYLAQVGHPPDTKTTIALCIVSTQPGDESVVTRVGDIFARTFAKDAVLDVVFLEPDQETDLRKVCRAFYSRAT